MISDKELCRRLRMGASDYPTAGIAAKRIEELGRWRDISSAPKDGSHIQLYRPEIQFVGYFATRAKKWAHNAPGLPFMDPPPTHWKPLPEEPHG